MSWFKKKRIYLDYAAATPVLHEARSAMEKYWSDDFYNPSAIYEEGVRVGKEVEEYRTQIARLLGVGSKEIIFTSGGTESNVWAIHGIKNPRIFIEEGSHPSVSESSLLKASKWQDATIVSSATTDNKLGRQIKEYRKKSNKTFPLLHIDASQTASYFPVGLEVLACDLLTLDSAKLGGPKGIGALVIRRGTEIDLPPLGTPPVSLIAGFTKALEIAFRDREREAKRLISLSALFVNIVKRSLPQAEITQNLPNIINVSVLGILPEFLVLALDQAGVLVSAGPACNSNKPEPPDTPVRVSLGRNTTEKKIKNAAEIFCKVVSNMVK